MSYPENKVSDWNNRKTIYSIRFESLKLGSFDCNYKFDCGKKAMHLWFMVQKW